MAKKNTTEEEIKALISNQKGRLDAFDVVEKHFDKLICNGNPPYLSQVPDTDFKIMVFQLLRDLQGINADPNMLPIVVLPDKVKEFKDFKEQTREEVQKLLNTLLVAHDNVLTPKMVWGSAYEQMYTNLTRTEGQIQERIKLFEEKDTENKNQKSIEELKKISNEIINKKTYVETTLAKNYFSHLIIDFPKSKTQEKDLRTMQKLKMMYKLDKSDVRKCNELAQKYVEGLIKGLSINEQFLENLTNIYDLKERWHFDKFDLTKCNTLAKTYSDSLIKNLSTSKAQLQDLRVMKRLTEMFEHDLDLSKCKVEASIINNVFFKKEASPHVILSKKQEREIHKINPIKRVVDKIMQKVRVAEDSKQVYTKEVLNLYKKFFVEVFHEHEDRIFKKLKKNERSFINEYAQLVSEVTKQKSNVFEGVVGEGKKVNFQFSGKEPYEIIEENEVKLLIEKAINTTKRQETIKSLKTNEMFLDERFFKKNKPTTQEVINDLINKLHKNKKQTLFLKKIAEVAKKTKFVVDLRNTGVDLRKLAKVSFEGVNLKLTEAQSIERNAYKDYYAVRKAIEKGDIDAIRNVLQNREFKVPNPRNVKPLLHIAAEKCSPRIVGLLLTYGASPKDKVYGSAFKGMDAKKNSADEKETVLLLMNAGDKIPRSNKVLKKKYGGLASQLSEFKKEMKLEKIGVQLESACQLFDIDQKILEKNIPIASFLLKEDKDGVTGFEKLVEAGKQEDISNALKFIEKTQDALILNNVLHNYSATFKKEFKILKENLKKKKNPIVEDIINPIVEDIINLYKSATDTEIVILREEGKFTNIGEIPLFFQALKKINTEPLPDNTALKDIHDKSVNYFYGSVKNYKKNILRSITLKLDGVKNNRRYLNNVQKGLYLLVCDGKEPDLSELYANESVTKDVAYFLLTKQEYNFKGLNRFTENYKNVEEFREKTTFENCKKQLEELLKNNKYKIPFQSLKRELETAIAQGCSVNMKDSMLACLKKTPSFYRNSDEIKENYQALEKMRQNFSEVANGFFANYIQSVLECLHKPFVLNKQEEFVDVVEAAKYHKIPIIDCTKEGIDLSGIDFSTVDFGDVLIKMTDEQLNQVKATPQLRLEVAISLNQSDKVEELLKEGVKPSKNSLKRAIAVQSQEIVDVLIKTLVSEMFDVGSTPKERLSQICNLARGNKNIVVDLRGVDLRGVDLRGVDIRGVNFEGVKFTPDQRVAILIEKVSEKKWEKYFGGTRNNTILQLKSMLEKKDLQDKSMEVFEKILGDHEQLFEDLEKETAQEVATTKLLRLANKHKRFAKRIGKLNEKLSDVQVELQKGQEYSIVNILKFEKLAPEEVFVAPQDLDKQVKNCRFRQHKTMVFPTNENVLKEINLDGISFEGVQHNLTPAILSQMQSFDKAKGLEPMVGQAKAYIIEVSQKALNEEIQKIDKPINAEMLNDLVQKAQAYSLTLDLRNKTFVENISVNGIDFQNVNFLITNEQFKTFEDVDKSKGIEEYTFVKGFDKAQNMWLNDKSEGNDFILYVPQSIHKKYRIETFAKAGSTVDYEGKKFSLSGKKTVKDDVIAKKFSLKDVDKNIARRYLEEIQGKIFAECGRAAKYIPLERSQKTLGMRALAYSILFDNLLVQNKGKDNYSFESKEAFAKVFESLVSYLDDTFDEKQVAALYSAPGYEISPERERINELVSLLQDTAFSYTERGNKNIATCNQLLVDEVMNAARKSVKKDDIVKNVISNAVRTHNNKVINGIAYQSAWQNLDKRSKVAILQDAVRLQNVEALDKLLENRPMVDIKGKKEKEPLAVAYGLSQHELTDDIVRVLGKHDAIAVPGKARSWQKTKVVEAANRRYKKLRKAPEKKKIYARKEDDLLSIISGKNVEELNKYFEANTPVIKESDIEKAIRNSQTEILSVLIKEYNPRQTIASFNKDTKDASRFFEIATRQQSPEVIKALFDSGLEPEVNFLTNVFKHYTGKLDSPKLIETVMFLDEKGYKVPKLGATASKVHKNLGGKYALKNIVELQKLLVQDIESLRSCVVEDEEMYIEKIKVHLSKGAVLPDKYKHFSYVLDERHESIYKDAMRYADDMIGFKITASKKQLGKYYKLIKQVNKVEEYAQKIQKGEFVSFKSVDHFVKLPSPVNKFQIALYKLTAGELRKGKKSVSGEAERVHTHIDELLKDNKDKDKIIEFLIGTDLEHKKGNSLRTLLVFTDIQPETEWRQERGNIFQIGSAMHLENNFDTLALAKRVRSELPGIVKGGLTKEAIKKLAALNKECLEQMKHNIQILPKNQTVKRKEQAHKISRMSHDDVIEDIKKRIEASEGISKEPGKFVATMKQSAALEVTFEKVQQFSTLLENKKFFYHKEKNNKGVKLLGKLQDSIKHVAGFFAYQCAADKIPEGNTALLLKQMNDFLQLTSDLQQQKLVDASIIENKVNNIFKNAVEARFNNPKEYYGKFIEQMSTFTPEGLNLEKQKEKFQWIKEGAFSLQCDGKPPNLEKLFENKEKAKVVAFAILADHEINPDPDQKELIKGSQYGCTAFTQIFKDASSIGDNDLDRLKTMLQECIHRKGNKVSLNKISDFYLRKLSSFFEYPISGMKRMVSSLPGCLVQNEAIKKKVAELNKMKKGYEEIQQELVTDAIKDEIKKFKDNDSKTMKFGFIVNILGAMGSGEVDVSKIALTDFKNVQFHEITGFASKVIMTKEQANYVKEKNSKLFDQIVAVPKSEKEKPLQPKLTPKPEISVKPKLKIKTKAVPKDKEVLKKTLLNMYKVGGAIQKKVDELGLKIMNEDLAEIFNKIALLSEKIVKETDFSTLFTGNDRKLLEHNKYFQQVNDFINSLPEFLEKGQLHKDNINRVLEDINTKIFKRLEGLEEDIQRNVEARKPVSVVIKIDDKGKDEVEAVKNMESKTANELYEAIIKKGAFKGEEDSSIQYKVTEKQYNTVMHKLIQEKKFGVLAEFIGSIVGGNDKVKTIDLTDVKDLKAEDLEPFKDTTVRLKVTLEQFKLCKSAGLIGKEDKLSKILAEPKGKEALEKLRHGLDLAELKKDIKPKDLKKGRGVEGLTDPELPPKPGKGR